MCSNILKIVDPESNRTVMLELSPEEHIHASTDMVYAQQLLNNFYNSENEYSEKNVNENCMDDLSDESVWTEAETLLLITLYADHKEDFSHARKKKYVWDIVAEKMAAHNYNKTAQKIERKWINLLRTYRAIKDNKGPKKSGRGAQSYKYFEKLDEILGDKPSNKSNIVIEVGVQNNMVEQHNSQVLSSLENRSSVTNENYNESTDVSDISSPSTSEIKIQKKGKRLLKNEKYYEQKQKRHEERMRIEQEKLEVEKKKIKLLETLVDHKLKRHVNREEEDREEDTDNILL